MDVCASPITEIVFSSNPLFSKLYSLKYFYSLLPDATSRTTKLNKKFENDCMIIMTIFQIY